MQVAMGAIAVGVILTVGYLLVAHVRNLMPTESAINDTNFTNSLAATQPVVIAGFGLLAVGVIVLAAFGLVNIFK